MSKEKNNETNPMWSFDEFALHEMQAAFVGAFNEPESVMDTMSQYQVDYELDLRSIGDALAVRLSVQVNSETLWPGYRIKCVVQNDYISPTIPHIVSTDIVSTEDREFFIQDTYEAMHDQIVAITSEMPLGEYFLPPPDLKKMISTKNQQILN